MSGKAKEDRMENQSPAMRRLIREIRRIHDAEMSRVYKATKDKFIYNMF